MDNCCHGLQLNFLIQIRLESAMIALCHSLLKCLAYTLAHTYTQQKFLSNLFGALYFFLFKKKQQQRFFVCMCVTIFINKISESVPFDWLVLIFVLQYFIFTLIECVSVSVYEILSFCLCSLFVCTV